MLPIFSAQLGGCITAENAGRKTQLVLATQQLVVLANCQMPIAKCKFRETHWCACGDSMSLRRRIARMANWIVSFPRQYACSRPAARRTVC